MLFCVMLNLLVILLYFILFSLDVRKMVFVLLFIWFKYFINCNVCLCDSIIFFMVGVLLKRLIFLGCIFFLCVIVVWYVFIDRFNVIFIRNVFGFFIVCLFWLVLNWIYVLCKMFFILFLDWFWCMSVDFICDMIFGKLVNMIMFIMLMLVCL